MLGISNQFAERLGIVAGAVLVVGFLAFAMRRGGKAKAVGGPVLLLVILAAILVVVLVFALSS